MNLSDGSSTTVKFLNKKLKNKIKKKQKSGKNVCKDISQLTGTRYISPKHGFYAKHVTQDELSDSNCLIDFPSLSLCKRI